MNEGMYGFGKNSMSFTLLELDNFARTWLFFSLLLLFDIVEKYLVSELTKEHTF